MSEMKLKPCPFCGVVYRQSVVNEKDGFITYMEYKTPEEAAAAWNRRAKK